MSATATMVGQSIGAELYARAKEVAMKALMFVSAILTIGTLISTIVEVFVNDVYVVGEGSKMLFLCFILYTFLWVFSVIGGIARDPGTRRCSR